jgi:hypothetical protein
MTDCETIIAAVCKKYCVTRDRLLKPLKRNGETFARDELASRLWRDAGIAHDAIGQLMDCAPGNVKNMEARFRKRRDAASQAKAAA